MLCFAFLFGSESEAIPPGGAAPPGGSSAAVEASRWRGRGLLRARRLPRDELREAGTTSLPAGRLGKQAGRDAEQAKELSPPLSEEAWICPVLGGRRPAVTGGAGGSRLAGAAGVGLGAGGSCGQESGTGAAGRKGGIRRTRCELRQPGEATRAEPLRRWERGVSKYLSSIAARREGGAGRRGTAGSVPLEPRDGERSRGGGPASPTGNECPCPRVSVPPPHPQQRESPLEPLHARTARERHRRRAVPGSFLSHTLLPRLSFAFIIYVVPCDIH